MLKVFDEVKRMASRLFQTVVASSVLLLSGAGATGCASSVTGLGADAGTDVLASDAPSRDVLAQDVPAPDVSQVADTSVADVSMADVLADVRAREAGWPTTKGVYCRTPDVGPAYCCRYATPDEICVIPTEPDGSGPLCTVDPQTGVCTPCNVAPDASTCATTDASAGGE